jgi:hypothetical protein
MTPNDQVLAYIRTYVPYAIGAFVAWLLATFTLTLPDEFVVAVIAFAVVAVQNLYYLVIRLLERWAPMLGVFLGFPKQPAYTGVADLWGSVVRTGIPTIVGGILGLAAALGLQLDSETQAGLIVILIGVLQAVYYAGAKELIARWPSTGWLLGGVPAPAVYLSARA